MQGWPPFDDAITGSAALSGDRGFGCDIHNTTSRLSFQRGQRVMRHVVVVQQIAVLESLRILSGLALFQPYSVIDNPPLFTKNVEFHQTPVWLAPPLRKQFSFVERSTQINPQALAARPQVRPHLVPRQSVLIHDDRNATLAGRRPAQ